jgi:hypothetical protein
VAGYHAADLFRADRDNEVEVATNNGVQSSFSPTALTITQGSAVMSNEPMLEYWSD